MLPGELEQIVARHVPGAGPVDLRRLSEGPVNQTYRALRGGHAYAVRVPTTSGGLPGLDHSWESRVLKCAASADLAPAVEYCDPECGVLISRWVCGRTWRPPEARHHSGISRMASLMRNIHALPIPERPRQMSPMEWIDHYSTAADASAGHASDELLSLRPAAILCAAALTELPPPQLPPPPQLVLCHSDLHTLNLIDRGNSLVLLDWEYAHVADPLWDLAGWSANNDFEDASKLELLAAYLGRPPSPEECSRLALLGWLYDYVCLLWCQLDFGQEVRGERLLARLVATAGSRTR